MNIKTGDIIIYDNNEFLITEIESDEDYICYYFEPAHDGDFFMEKDSPMYKNCIIKNN
jgi:hypothetical protein